MDKTDSIYSIEDLVSAKRITTHIHNLRPFIYDPICTNPLTFAQLNEKVFIVKWILGHRRNRNCRSTLQFNMRWSGFDESSGSSHTTWLSDSVCTSCWFARFTLHSDFYTTRVSLILTPNFLWLSYSLVQHRGPPALSRALHQLIRQPQLMRQCSPSADKSFPWDQNCHGVNTFQQESYQLCRAVSQECLTVPMSRSKTTRWPTHSPQNQFDTRNIVGELILTEVMKSLKDDK